MKAKLITKTPMALLKVCKPRIEAVGRVLDRRSAGLARGNVNAIVIVQIPSMNTQHHSLFEKSLIESGVRARTNNFQFFVDTHLNVIWK